MDKVWALASVASMACFGRCNTPLLAKSNGLGTTEKFVSSGVPARSLKRSKLPNAVSVAEVTTAPAFFSHRCSFKVWEAKIGLETNSKSTTSPWLIKVNQRATGHLGLGVELAKLKNNSLLLSARLHQLPNRVNAVSTSTFGTALSSSSKARFNSLTILSSTRTSSANNKCSCCANTLNSAGTSPE